MIVRRISMVFFLMLAAWSTLFATDELVLPLPETAEVTRTVSLNSQGKNPHSKALGQRIAGGILTGLGAGNFVAGVIIDAADIYVALYSDFGMESTGEVLEKVGWITGLVYLGVGVPLLVTGKSKHAKWKQWQHDHGIAVSLNGSSLVIEF